MFINWLFICLQDGLRAKGKSKQPLVTEAQQRRERLRHPQEPLTQEVQQELQLPPYLREIYNIVSKWPDGECVNACIDYDVFATDMSGLYILKSDILEFVRGEKIGQTIIVSYIRYHFTNLVYLTLFIWLISLANYVFIYFC